MGKIWLSKGQPAQAAECFDAIGAFADGEPDLADFDLKAGEALYQLRRFAEARQRLEIAAEKDKSSPNIRMLVGNCLLTMRKPAEAAEWYRRVLALDAYHPFAHHNLAVCLFQLGRYGAGVNHCLDALRAKPDYVMAMHNAALAYLQLAQWRDARAMLRRALRHDPGNETLEQLVRRIWRYRLKYYTRTLSGVIRRALGRPTR